MSDTLVQNILATLLVLAGLGLLAFLVRKAMDHFGGIDSTESEREREFESQLLSQVRGTPAPPPPGMVPPPLPANPITPAPASDGSLEELARRLQSLNVLSHSEGRIPMPIPPDGLIYRMRSGGLCALLPRLDGEDVLLHHARRFQMLVIQTRTNDPIIIERMQDRLPRLLDESGRMP